MPAPILQVKRGALSNLPGLRAGEPAFTTDTFDFFVGIDSTTNNNKFLGSNRYWTKETSTTGSGIRFVERTDGGSNYIELKAPNTAIASNVTYVLPAVQGASQSVLSNDGSGNLSWASGSNNATFTGITTFSDTTDSTSRDNGSIIIEGGVGIEKSVNIGGNIYVSGISTFNGLTITNNNLDVQAHAEIQELSVVGIASVSGDLMVDGTILADGDVRILGITTVSNTTESTTYQDGAVIIDGGLGVAKNLNLHGNLKVDGNVTIGGTFISLKGQDVYIENKDIILGFTTSITPNDDTANHAGVAIASTEGTPLVSFTASGINTLSDTYKQLMWFKSGTLGFSTDAFSFNYGLAIGTTSMANGVRLAVGSDVTVTDTTVNAITGNFTNLTGSLTGTISTATRSTTVDIIGIANNQNYNLTFANGSGIGNTVGVDAELLYNPNTNVLTAPNINSGSIRASDGTTAITITSTTGAVGFANSVTVNGDLYVLGTTTEVNTSTLKVEDTLVDLGLVNDNGVLVPPSSNLNLDIGILFNWYSGSARKASVYWDDSLQRVGIASDVTESTGVLTVNAYAAVEIGSLWVTDCAGTSQVISCTGGERFLENITVDAGAF
jgi:cytoskeletal protein CcmA (bactofilin family)